MYRTTGNKGEGKHKEKRRPSRAELDDGDDGNKESEFVVVAYQRNPRKRFDPRFFICLCLSLILSLLRHIRFKLIDSLTALNLDIKRNFEPRGSLSLGKKLMNRPIS